MVLKKNGKKLKETKKKKQVVRKRSKKEKVISLPEKPFAGPNPVPEILSPQIEPELPQTLEEPAKKIEPAKNEKSAVEAPQIKTEAVILETPQETEAETEETEFYDQSAEEKNYIEFLQFRLADEDYAFRVAEIGEILKPHNVTPVPRLDPYVLGVSSLRGKVIPLIDLKKRLGLAAKQEINNKKERIITLNGPKGLIGAWVDSVVDVLRIPEEMLQDPPGHLSESEARYIEGTALWEGKFISIIRTSEALNIDMDD